MYKYLTAFNNYLNAQMYVCEVTSNKKLKHITFMSLFSFFHWLITVIRLFYLYLHLTSNHSTMNVPQQREALDYDQHTLQNNVWSVLPLCLIFNNVTKVALTSQRIAKTFKNVSGCGRTSAAQTLETENNEQHCQYLSHPFIYWHGQ